MRKIATLTATIALACSLHAQTVVVSDPTSIAQRLLLATQEMDEMIEQKYKFVEQIELLKKQAQEAQKVRERLQKVSNAIKKGHEIVGILTQAEHLMELNKKIRHSIMDKATSLSDETILGYVELMVQYTTEISNIVIEAKKAVQDNNDLLEDSGEERNDSGSHKMSDAERIERLRQVKEDLREIHDKIATIYYRLNRIHVNNSRLHFIQSLY